jgi:N-acetylmuramoyl-L-alanine amidase
VRKIIYTLFGFLIVTTVVFAQANPTQTPFVLTLDAGHGGRDAGAKTKNKKVKEKDINLAVTLLAGKYIAEQHPDVKIVYTRKTDVYLELNKRTSIANKAKSNLFISIHANAGKHSSVCGAEVYAFGTDRSSDNFEVVRRENSVITLEDNYREKYENFDPNSAESYILFQYMQNKYLEQSLDFAAMVLNEMEKCVSWKARGVKQDVFAVLRKSSMPSILIELDFITNPEACKFLTSKAGQEKEARAIAKAFTLYKNAYDKKNAISATTENQPESKPEQKPAVTEIKAQSSEKKSVKTGKTVYKVQILAGANYIPKNSPELKGYAAQYYIENNLYKYTYGESSNLEKIKAIRKSLLKDFKDAFIVRFENGVKVATIY